MKPETWNLKHGTVIMNHQQLTKDQALQKLRQYCGYQERCHADVVSRLYDLGVWKKEHDELIATLIEENYLNEERFAKSFAGGHFRVKDWGRVKILHELKRKQISPYCIKQAMKEIDEDDYRKRLQQLFDQKWNSLKGERNRFIKMRKTSTYLLQKGYEAELVKQLFNTDEWGN